MKKMLMIATVPSMIGQFNMNNISILLGLGYEVHVACDWTDRSIWTSEKVNKLKLNLENLKIKCIQVDYSRVFYNLKGHIKSYQQTIKILKENEYVFVHCHTPIASAIARLACKNTKTKCIYTAHGFHFYKGSSLQNWILFYPIEKWLSKYTDILITINREDYKRSKKYFHAKRIVYVPGVGIDIDRFKNGKINIENKRVQLGVGQNELMLLSVGELSKRKNHEVIIKALKKINNPNIKYFIVGKGELKEYLEKLVINYHMENNVKLLGYRNDIAELCHIADLFVFPSHQEGLPVALMEAIACHTPIICSKIRGNEDLITDSSCTFNENYVESIVKCINSKVGNKTRTDFKEYMNNTVLKNYNHLKLFELENINEKMKKIYLNI